MWAAGLPQCSDLPLCLSRGRVLGQRLIGGGMALSGEMLRQRSTYPYFIPSAGALEERGGGQPGRGEGSGGTAGWDQGAWDGWDGTRGERGGRRAGQREWHNMAVTKKVWPCPYDSYV